MDWSYILTNQWFEYVLKNYSCLIGLMLALLKAWAIMHPGTPSNKIIDLLQGIIFKKKQ